jgi:predicted metal-dependent hydrolase
VSPKIVPREKLDFGLDGDIPKYWFDGDPFKTRLIDAMSAVFPEGEKFFISCVRDFRDQITDPKLAEDVKCFTRQEGQHTMVHNQYNERLKRQGIPVDKIAERQRRIFDKRRAKYSKGFTLALTAASEHVTAIMTHAFFDRRSILEKADPRMRAMYAWHSVEELEHKAVAFDVMRNIAKVGYFKRCAAMLLVTWSFTVYVLLVARLMLQIDGFDKKERRRMFVRGLWWLYSPRGLFPPVIGHLLSYYRPGYHPWQSDDIEKYEQWISVFKSTGDAIAAGDALHLAGT